MKKSKGYYKEKWKLIPKHTKGYIIGISLFVLLAVIILLVLSFYDFSKGEFNGTFTFWGWVGREGWLLFVILGIILISAGFMYWLTVRKGGVGK